MLFGMRPRAAPPAVAPAHMDASAAHLIAPVGSHEFTACFDAAGGGADGVPILGPGLAGTAWLTVDAVAGPRRKPDGLGAVRARYASAGGLAVSVTSAGAVTQEVAGGVTTWPPWCVEVQREHVGATGTVVRRLTLSPVAAAAAGLADGSPLPPVCHILYPDGATCWWVPSGYLPAVVAGLVARAGTRTDAPPPTHGSGGVEHKDGKADDDDGSGVGVGEEAEAAPTEAAASLVAAAAAPGVTGLWVTSSFESPALVVRLAGIDAPPFTLPLPPHSSLAAVRARGGGDAEVSARYEVCPLPDPVWQQPPPPSARPRTLYRKAAELLRTLAARDAAATRHAAATATLLGSLWSGAAADAGGGGAGTPAVGGALARVSRTRRSDGTMVAVHADGTHMAVDGASGRTLVAAPPYASLDLDSRFDAAAAAHCGAGAAAATAAAAAGEGSASSRRSASGVTSGPRTRRVITTPDGTALAVDYDATVTGHINGRLRIHRADGVVLIATDDGSLQYRPARCAAGAVAAAGGAAASTEGGGGEAPSQWMGGPDRDVMDGVQAASLARGLAPLVAPGSHTFHLRTGGYEVHDDAHNTFSVTPAGGLRVDIAGALGLARGETVVPAVPTAPSDAQSELWHLPPPDNPAALAAWVGMGAGAGASGVVAPPNASPVCVRAVLPRITGGRPPHVFLLPGAHAHSLLQAADVTRQAVLLLPPARYVARRVAALQCRAAAAAAVGYGGAALAVSSTDARPSDDGDVPPVPDLSPLPPAALAALSRSLLAAFTATHGAAALAPPQDGAPPAYYAAPAAAELVQVGYACEVGQWPGSSPSGVGLVHTLGGTLALATCDAAWVFTRKLKRRRTTKVEVFGATARTNTLVALVPHDASAAAAPVAPLATTLATTLGATLGGGATARPVAVVSTGEPHADWAALAAVLGSSAGAGDLAGRFGRRVLGVVPALATHVREVAARAYAPRLLCATAVLRHAVQMPRDAWRLDILAAAAAHAAWRGSLAAAGTHFECIDSRDGEALEAEAEAAARVIGARAAAGTVSAGSGRSPLHGADDGLSDAALGAITNRSGGSASPTASGGKADVAATAEAARAAAAAANAVRAARDTATQRLRGMFTARAEFSQTGTLAAAAQMMATVPALHGAEAAELPVVAVAGRVLADGEAHPPASTELLGGGGGGGSGSGDEELASATLRLPPPSPAAAPLSSPPARAAAPAMPTPPLPPPVVLPGKKATVSLSAQQRAAAREARERKAALRQLAAALEHARVGSAGTSRGSALPGTEAPFAAAAAAAAAAAPPAPVPITGVPEDDEEHKAGDEYDGEPVADGGVEREAKEADEEGDGGAAYAAPGAPPLLVSEEASAPAPSPPSPIRSPPRSAPASPPRPLAAAARSPPASTAVPVATAGPLVVSPCLVDFGTVPVGALLHATVTLKNTAPTTVRWRVGRGDTAHAPGGNSCRLIADIGPLAAFLTRPVEVELLTREPGRVERVLQLACAAGSLPVMVRATVSAATDGGSSALP